MRRSAIRERPDEGREEVCNEARWMIEDGTVLMKRATWRACHTGGLLVTRVKVEKKA